MIQLTMIEDHFDKLEKRLRDLENSSAFVGYDRNQSGIHEDSGLPYADLMAILSAGVSSNNMPARPIFKYVKGAYDIRTSPLKKDLTKYFSKIKNNTAPISTDKINKHWIEDIGEDVFRMFGSTSHLADNKQSTQDQKGFNAPLVNESDLRDNLGYSIDGKPIKKLKNI